MDDCDGDLSNVNPDLLKLCANAEDWKEQRRRAMKAKIFGAGGASSDQGNASTPAGPSPSAATARAPESQQASEAYILQQILSRKRRHEEATNQQQSQQLPTSAVGGHPQAQPRPPYRQHQQQQQYAHQEQQYALQQQHYQHQQPAPAPTSGEGELSLKEKLMRKYNKN